MLRSLLGVSIGWLGISMIADGVPALLLPYQLSVAGNDSAAVLGLTTLLAIALAALAQPVAGRWSDRIGRFPVIAAGVILAGGGLALLLVPSMALGGVIVVLIGASVAQAGQQALLPDRLPTDWRGRGAGAKGVLDVGGAFLGFLLLAALLGAGNTFSAVLVLGLALVGPFFVAYVLLPRGGAANHASASGRSGIRAVFSLDRREHAPLIRLIVARFLFLLGVYVVGRFLFFFVAARFALEPEAAGREAGSLLAALALVTVLAAVPSGWLTDRWGRRPLLLVGGVLGAVGIALLPAVGSSAELFAAGALLAVGSAGFSAASWAALSDLSSGAEAGRLLGLAHVGTAGAAALAGAFGLLIDLGERMAPLAGYGLSFAIAAGCALAGGLLAWRLRPLGVDPRSLSRPVEVAS